MAPRTEVHKTTPRQIINATNQEQHNSTTIRTQPDLTSTEIAILRTVTDKNEPPPNQSSFLWNCDDRNQKSAECRTRRDPQAIMINRMAYYNSRNPFREKEVLERVLCEVSSMISSDQDFDQHIEPDIFEDRFGCNQ